MLSSTKVISLTENVLLLCRHVFRFFVHWPVLLSVGGTDSDWPFNYFLVLFYYVTVQYAECLSSSSSEVGLCIICPFLMADLSWWPRRTFLYSGKIFDSLPSKNTLLLYRKASISTWSGTALALKVYWSQKRCLFMKSSINRTACMFFFQSY